MLIKSPAWEAQTWRSSAKSFGAGKNALNCYWKQHGRPYQLLLPPSHYHAKYYCDPGNVVIILLLIKNNQSFKSLESHPRQTPELPQYQERILGATLHSLYSNVKAVWFYFKPWQSVMLITYRKLPDYQIERCNSFRKHHISTEVFAQAPNVEIRSSLVTPYPFFQ